MKKLPLIAFTVTCMTLAACGQKTTPVNNTIITPDTTIESKEQAAQVCAPFIKYLECSLEKAPEAKKATHQKILDDTNKKIANDDPARIAQQCDTYIKILKANPDIAFKNGCTLEDNPLVQTDAQPKTTVTPTK